MVVWLEEVCGDVPEFQAAFTRNRSVNDHVFVTRRILEKCWRAGKRVYVASLNIEKAFDNVEYQAVIDCLLRYSVPHCLINIIIDACFYDHLCGMDRKRSWFKRQTKLSSFPVHI